MKEIKKQSKAKKVTAGVLKNDKDNVESKDDNQDDLETLKVTELKDILKKKNLPLDGKKSDLIERIRNIDHDEDLVTHGNELVPVTTPFSLPSQEVISMTSFSKALLLVLVGLPGSGKSTLANDFCDDDSVKRQWEVCCQDELKTRQKVVSTTETYLRNGQSVIIDRCNYDVEQRSHWLDIALRFEIPIFCLVLPHANDITFCNERAVIRDGSSFLRVIKPMSNKYREPSMNEGFTHVFYCSNDSDKDNALNVLKQL